MKKPHILTSIQSGLRTYSLADQVEVASEAGFIELDYIARLGDMYTSTLEIQRLSKNFNYL